jgi:hypothetical protein
VKVVVVGGGPLGLLYAAQLRRVDAQVTLVRRSASASSERWRVRSNLFGRSFEVELPVSTEVPSCADVVVLAVRGEQLTSELLAGVVAAKPHAIVSLTPALGDQLTAFRGEHPGLVAAMPAVAVEITNKPEPVGELRYWVAPSTLIEQRDTNPALAEFVRRLRRAGIPTRWTRDAASRAVANTIALFPLHVAIFLEPSFRRWSSQPQLLAELASAMRRARRLAVLTGPVEPALRVLAWWLSSAVRLRVAVCLQLWFAPRLTAFLEHHFGPKLGAQHATLHRDVEALARRHGVPAPLSAEWVSRLPSG